MSVYLLADRNYTYSSHSSNINIGVSLLVIYAVGRILSGIVRSGKFVSNRY